jgi:predicted ATP-dependent endonuclease of OLD family
MAFIESFSIKSLFGKKDVNLTFKGKAQIYIGENGLGKTTVLNALNYLLNCDFNNLINILFSRVDIVINHISFSFSKEEIKTYLQAQESRTRRAGFYQSLTRSLDDNDVKKLQSIIRSGKTEMVRMQEVQQYLNSRGYSFNAPSDYIMDIVTQIVVDRAEINQIDRFKQLMSELNVRVLYFPTYRRIEKDVRAMLKERRNRSRIGYTNRELDLESSFVEELSEAIHSGMSDIKKRRDMVLRKISDTSRKELDTLSVDLLKKQIAGIHDKITLAEGDIEKIETIIHKSQVGLTQAEQDEVMRKVRSNAIYDDENKFLLYLLTRLIDIYNSYEAYDQGIKSFVEVCNNYLRDKKFSYNEADLILDLESTAKTELIQEVIDLDILSSGEKQLIALFATIYLDPQNNFIVLIDEPELSLSIYWQRKLLPDVVKSPNCVFLFAVTHSPFIFENELQEYTTGMNEFVKS